MLSKLFNITQAPILEVLLKESYHDPLKRYDLMNALLAAKVYVKGFKKGKELFLNYEEDSLLAFTSKNALQNAKQHLNDYAYCEVSSILKVIPSGIRFLLNTGPNYGKEFLPSELSFLKEGKIPPWVTQRFNFRPGQKMVIKNPKTYPQKLIDALFEKMKNRENVEKAYIAEIFSEGSERPNLIVGIKVLNPLNFQKDLVGMVGVVEGNVGAGEYVDFIQIMDQDNSSIGNFMLRETKPFFDRAYI